MFRKIIILGLCSVAVVLSYVTVVPLAAGESDYQKQLNAFGQGEGMGNTVPADPRETVAKLIKATLGVVGIIVFALMVYGGFLVLTSGGAEDKIEKGKKILLYSIAGVAVILAAYSITILVYRSIHDSWLNPPIPIEDDTLQNDLEDLYPEETEQAA